MRTRGLLPALFLEVSLIFAFPALAADPIQFSPGDSYAIPATPYLMATGDFNQDGWPDIVTVDTGSSNYSILMNNGSGGFTVATYPAGTNPRNVVVVELAGDTIQDLVISSGTGHNLLVFTGAGDGTFTLSSTVAAGGIADSTTDGIAGGDFNGDGYPDVAVCLPYDYKVAVLLGTPGGSFGPPTTYNTGQAFDVAVGLVNADGYQDIVTANGSSNNISVLLGNGNGTFGTSTNISDGNYNTGVALADINHDGKLDAVMAAELSSTVVIMLGDGAGGFAFSQALSVVTQHRMVRVADFNQDGLLDIAAAVMTSPGFVILQATGSNTFMAAAPYDPDPGSNGLAIADFNRDTGPDIATSHSNNTVRVMKVMVNTDTDGDGMPNGWENQYPCMNPLAGDSTLDADSDGLRNIQEFAAQTNPCLADTDGDGLNDGDEVHTYLTDPAKADTDGDGMPDGWEVAHPCMKPTVADPGLDYDNDSYTNLYEYQHALDPCFAVDTDGDLMPDSWEDTYASCGINPNVPDADLDADDDGLTNLKECQSHSDPCQADPDGDGLNDGAEVYVYHTDPATPDTDGDGTNDGYEVAIGSNPLDATSYPRLMPGGSDIRVTYHPSAKTSPYLVWTGSQYGIAWSDNRDGNAEIYFRRLAADGATVGAEARVTFARLDSFLPAMAWSGSEFGLSYHDWRDDGDGLCNYFAHPFDDCRMNLYFSRLGSDGVKQGGDTGFAPAQWDDTTCTGRYTRSHIVWTGSEYGIYYEYLYWAMPEMDLARISPSGAILDRQGVGVQGFLECGQPTDFVWAGTEYGSAFTFGVNLPAAVVVNGSSVNEPYSPMEGSGPQLAWSGSEYYVRWQYPMGMAFRRLSVQEQRLGPAINIQAAAGYLYQVGGYYLVSATGDQNGALLPSFNVGSLVFTGSEYGKVWLSGNEIYFARLVLDRDGDGLTDNDETNLHGTDPANWDTDGDRLSDGAEVLTYHSNPLQTDSDADGLSDYAEAITYHTNPSMWDSDGDRLPDKFEVDNAAHAGGGLDPINALDGAADFDGDGNSNKNEYYNGGDPWNVDPTPGQSEAPGCYYWADGDGDGNPAPSDLVMMKLEIAGVAQEYREILPHGTDTLDLDRDGHVAPSDEVMLRLMIAGSEQPGGYPSQANSLEVVSAPTGTVAAGSTTHVTVSVHSVSGAPAFAPGFGVVFEVVSGNAVLLGGDGTANGEAAGNRYDFSMEAAAGAKANMVVLVTGSGPITLGVKIPACGANPIGRWNNQVLLASPVVINGP
jgi:hypothetical protein